MITPDKIRVPNEKESLSLAIGIMIVLFVFIMGISIGVFIIPLFLAVLYVKSMQGRLLGNSVKVTENQFPEIYDIISLASKNLSMPTPEVFIHQSPVLQAFAMGIWGRKSVVLHSALVETMNYSELASIIGHEFTHIKCGHTSWGILANLHSSIPIPIISDILSFIFNKWSRKAEYTCDRGGLIVNQNSNASVYAIAKLAVGKELFEKLDLDELKEQQVQISQDDLSRLTELLQTHPYLINRIQEIIRYSRSSEYMNLTSDIEGYDSVIYEDADSNKTEPGFYQEKQQDFCFECGENLATDDLICLNCGAIRNTENES